MNNEIEYVNEIEYINEIEYRGDWILINAYFYKFWMLRKEFNKYIIIDNDITESFNIQHITSKYSI